ncbi:MAG: hypothetical protein HY928_07765 [Elusimicrobia bacterium]|nr:hypothetical protein [Elusimicrobiota bacterium]
MAPKNRRVALATCRTLPEPDHDEAGLLGALRALGVEAETLAWDDPADDPARYDLCVVRSTWNYIHALPDFLAWLERTAAAVRLANPPRLMAWNCDKAYLMELALQGVPIIPTRPFQRGAWPSLDGVPWEDLVVKPRVGAASYGARRFPPGRRDAAEAYLRETCPSRDMLVQPYVRSVDGHGERALVWVDGELTHAVRKQPRLAGGDESVSQALSPEADERAFAERVLAPRREGLLYARVDVARAEDGGLMLMELELVEPSLFLAQSPPALERFARAIASY